MRLLYHFYPLTQILLHRQNTYIIQLYCISLFLSVLKMQIPEPVDILGKERKSLSC